MRQRPQFSLRTFSLVVAGLCALMAIFRVLTLEWRAAFAVSLVAALPALICVTATRETPRALRGIVLTVISLVCMWLLWMGLFPGMYYMAGPFLVILAWGGVFGGCFLLGTLGRAAQIPRRLQPTEWALVIVPLLTTLLLAFQVPMRAAAVGVLPALAMKLDEADSTTSNGISCGLYHFRAPTKRNGKSTEPVYFQMAHDGESAFVYSPNGIDDIVYNSGSKGRLFGDWYWIQED